MKKVTLTNIFPNPSFEEDLPFITTAENNEGMLGWFSTPQLGSSTTDDQIYKGEYSSEYCVYGARSLCVKKGRSVNPASSARFRIRIDGVVPGHKYYRCARMYQNGQEILNRAFVYFYTQAVTTTNALAGLNFGAVPKRWIFRSSVGTMNRNLLSNSIYAAILLYGTSYFTNNRETFLDGMMLIDLTEAFGDGNEPDAAWCDEHIPFFAGTIELDTIDLVTDRTEQDVEHSKHVIWAVKTKTATAAEIAEYNAANMKGSYNFSDVNRVMRAVAYLHDLLAAYGYRAKVNPVAWFLFPNNRMTGPYLENIRALRTAVPVLPSTPMVPENMDLFTYQKANDIEQILEDIEALVLNMDDSFWYAGDELYAGE